MSIETLLASLKAVASEVSPIAEPDNAQTDGDGEVGLAEETAIRAWLDAIGETDPEMVQAVLDHCRRDPEARDYFMRRASAEARPASDFPIPDDRRAL